MLLRQLLCADLQVASLETLEQFEQPGRLIDLPSVQNVWNSVRQQLAGLDANYR